MHPAQAYISLHIQAFESEPPLCILLTVRNPRLVDSDDSDHTAQINKLISVFAGHVIKHISAFY